MWAERIVWNLTMLGGKLIISMDTFCTHIWKSISTLPTPGFFITAEIHRQGNTLPEGMENFITMKMELIREGLAARRFVYQEGEWRIYLTFFPTTEVVSEKYALKNKVVSRGYK